MKTASAISTGLHAAVLLWALVSFSGKTFEVTPAESLPVDLVSDKDFSQLTKGIKDAPKLEMPKPRVEKIDEPKPSDDPAPKLTEKQEVKTTEQKAFQAPPQSKPDPISDKIRKLDEQKQQTKNEPLPPKKPVQEQPKFDANKIAALVFGAASGNAATLSQSEIDALRARLMGLWNPPVGIQNPQDYVIRIRVRLDRDGRLSAPPMVLTSGSGMLFGSARDSAVRAVFQGQPFDMLRPEHYETWKDIEVTFDPRDMFRS